MYAWLFYNLVGLQLTNTETYATKAESTRTKTITLRGKRGNITDSESVILAKDEYVYNVTFYRDSSTTTAASYLAYTNSIVKTIDIIESNGGKLAVDFDIERDEETGEWVFNFGSGVSETVLATRESQWRSNNYLTVANYPTAADCVERLKRRFRIVNTQEEYDAWVEESGGEESFAGAVILDEETMCKVMAIYCEMQMNIYSSQPIVIAEDVNYETLTDVETQSMMLPGMEIAVGTKRVYPKSKLAAQVIGYTGAISSQSSWLTYKAKGYAYNDKVGKDGIEYSMEDWLTQNSTAKQGSRVVERDQMSTIVRELSYTAPSDGDNVKLTLNASYQQVAERAIAANVADTRDVQEAKVVSDTWLESNKTAIANRNWEQYPL